MDNSIQKVAYETQGALLSNIETLSRINLNEAEIKSLTENIAIAWYNAGTGRMNATTTADKVANELFTQLKDLDRKEKELLKDWIYQGVHAGMAIFEGATVS